MQHADFVQFRQQGSRVIDGIVGFACDRADQVRPPLSAQRLNAIRADLETFKSHLFDEQDFFSNHKPLVYGAGMDLLEQVFRLLGDERIVLQRRLDTVINLAPDSIMCAGGVMTGLQNAIGALQSSAGGLAGSAFRFKQQRAEFAALKYARQHHTYRAVNEVHYANAYLNFSADALGIAARPDPFARTAEREMTVDGLNEFGRTVRQQFKPLDMASTMAQDYLSRIKDVAAIEPLENISADKIGAVVQRIHALQTSSLDMEFGPIPSHDFLLETPDDTFRIARRPTRIAVRLMERLKKENLVTYDPIVLANNIDGDATLLHLDGLLWLDRHGQHEPLTAPLLYSTNPQAILAALAAVDGIDNTSFPAIFCDIAQELDLHLRTEKSQLPPSGWLKNFAGVVNQIAGPRKRTLSTLLLNLVFEFDDAPALHALLEAGIDKEKKNINGLSLLALAAAHNRLNLLQELLAWPGDTDADSKAVTSAMMLAARNGHIASLTSLLDAGANINGATGEGWTALWIAAQHNQIEVVKLLLDAGANKHAVTRDGVNVLMAAARAGHAEVLRVLLASDVIRDAKDAGGYTALMMAAQSGHAKSVEMLLGEYAEIDCITEDEGHTALILAAIRGHAEVVKLLVDAGADMDQRSQIGHNALMEAAVSGQHTSVTALLAVGAPIEARSSYSQYTALMLAACDNEVTAMMILLDAGAHIDAATPGGQTALGLAAYEDSSVAVEVLASRGAHTEVRSPFGFTPLMIMAKRGQMRALRALLLAGADTHAQAPDGRTALAIAEEAGRRHAADLLRGAMAHRSR